MLGRSSLEAVFPGIQRCWIRCMSNPKAPLESEHWVTLSDVKIRTLAKSIDGKPPAPKKLMDMSGDVFRVSSSTYTFKKATGNASMESS